MRIYNSTLRPEGVGRQRENVKNLDRAPNITYGDKYDIEGNITFMK